MIEAAVELPVVRRAEKAGWFVRKVGWIGRVGAPDRVFIKDGRTVWIEFKSPGERPKLAQMLEHDRMKAAGAEVYWCDTAFEAMRILGI